MSETQVLSKDLEYADTSDLMLLLEEVSRLLHAFIESIQKSAS
jgi:hypothetical protein